MNSHIFYAAIGGFGMLGCFTSLTLQMKRIYSGYLQVKTGAPANLDGMFEFFEQNLEKSNYIVGWADARRGTPCGVAMRIANYLPPGADPNLAAKLAPGTSGFAGHNCVVPKSIMWMFMRPFMNNMGTSLVNSGQICQWAGWQRREIFANACCVYSLLIMCPIGRNLMALVA
ncbi:MAG: hypothetical protein R3E31_06820 [Chloroflexota bacterium]